jgi:serine/threonine protein kinase
MSKLSDYSIGKCINSDGSFGIIHVVKHMPTKEYYIMKKMSKREIKSSDMTRQIASEVKIHTTLNHPNIVKMIDYFEDEKYIYIVLEYMMKGDLYELLHNENKYEQFEEDEAQKIMKDIVSGVAYLHSKRIVHRDIKLENLLINEFDTVKVADFGLSVDLNELSELQSSIPPPDVTEVKEKPAKKILPKTRKDRKLEEAEDEMTVLCGTTEYMPPEMLKGEKYNEKVDVWALGIVMFELLTGDIPFDKRETKYKKFKDKRNRELFRKQVISKDIKYPDGMSSEAIDLMKKMLNKDPIKRISANEVLNHPWFTQTFSSQPDFDTVISVAPGHPQSSASSTTSS